MPEGLFGVVDGFSISAGGGAGVTDASDVFLTATESWRCRSLISSGTSGGSVRACVSLSTRRWISAGAHGNRKGVDTEGVRVRLTKHATARTFREWPHPGNRHFTVPRHHPASPAFQIGPGRLDVADRCQPPTTRLPYYCDSPNNFIPHHCCCAAEDRRHCDTSRDPLATCTTVALPTPGTVRYMRRSDTTANTA